MNENIIFPVAGGIFGTGVYSTMGGMGIVGGFGGIGIGITGMTAAGTIIGAAIYGGFKSIEKEDPTASICIGLGALSGVGIASTIGGIGVSFAGGAFGIGMTSIATLGGIVGLGLYGLATVFNSAANREPIGVIFNRSETTIFEAEAYNQAMMELNPVLGEIAWRQKFNDLEIDAELAELKSKINRDRLERENLNFTWIFYCTISITNCNFLKDTSIELTTKTSWKLVRVLNGHTNIINAVGVNDRIIASAGKDRTIRLWDLATEKSIYSLFDTSEIQNIAINDRLVVAGNFHSRITSWNLNNKSLTGVYFHQNRGRASNNRSHDGLIYRLIFSRDGRTIISSSADRTIKLWNAATGNLQSTLKAHTDAVTALAITSDDRFLISGGADKHIMIWDLANPQKTPDIFRGHDNWITDMAITNNDRHLITASLDRTIKIWDLVTKQLIKILTVDNSIWSIAISPDDKILATAALKESVILWNFTTGERLKKLNACSPVIFTKDGRYLIAGNQKHQLQIWQQSIELSVDLWQGEWWEILKVDRHASRNAIKRAYYNLARKYHPDLNKSDRAEEIMQIINLAYRQSSN
jgi:WD40 repeat protein